MSRFEKDYGFFTPPKDVHSEKKRTLFPIAHRVPRYEEIKKIDKERGVYKKIVLEQGKIVGAIILGDRKGVTSIEKLMDQKIDVTKYKDFLIEDDFDHRRIFT